MSNKLGVGFIGSGFVAKFHLQAWRGVRDADVLGVYSPNPEHAAATAALARDLRVGNAHPFSSIEEMVAAPEIDCVWLCGPNHQRLQNMQAICDALDSGKGKLIGIACEKPLARNVGEARQMVQMVERSGLLHGYLEDQIFAPSVTRGKEIMWTRAAALTGRPYLARAAEEHSGPHSPWFWRGELQGGGVLNDMMCHSVEVARFMLTKPGAPRSSIRPVKVSAQIASLKWSRPEYSDVLQKTMGAEVDYQKSPAEDFARATINYSDEDDNPLIVEVTTSWSYVGAGLRLSLEVLGPEYSLNMNSLDSGLKLFLSREVKGSAGEDLVEKQNAEQGLMPVLGNEAAEYGYESQNRYFVQCFLDGRQPEENFRAGLEVTELLMTAYMSAEQERTIPFRPEGLDTFVPLVAQGRWKAR
ncbi:MAG TPA: Gfo/Idh/MocA family oxidoreductase [Pyrinomonadaceae bacterium]|jgi:predicted dehydrogenase|nr:Gfo/Idh/MocA family oxidoreductase [Pyrinomonadaceae bacterium]